MMDVRLQTNWKVEQQRQKISLIAIVPEMALYFAFAFCLFSDLLHQEIGRTIFSV